MPHAYRFETHEIAPEQQPAPCTPVFATDPAPHRPNCRAAFPTENCRRS